MTVVDARSPGGGRTRVGRAVACITACAFAPVTEHTLMKDAVRSTALGKSNTAGLGHGSGRLGRNTLVVSGAVVGGAGRARRCVRRGSVRGKQNCRQRSGPLDIRPFRC